MPKFLHHHTQSTHLQDLQSRLETNLLEARFIGCAPACNFYWQDRWRRRTLEVAVETLRSYIGEVCGCCACTAKEEKGSNTHTHTLPTRPWN